MNCNVPTDILFSFRGFSRRGGATGPHADGWGIAFYEQRGCRLFHDPSPSAHSPMAQFIQQFPIKSTNVVAHIRKASRGRVCVENTHPFHRELWGRSWVFAHNGLLRRITQRPVTWYRPIGTTDSEHAFCYMLNRVRREFRSPPTVSRLARLLEKLGTDLSGLGEFNFLLCDARAMYAFCSKKLVYIQRQAPVGCFSGTTPMRRRRSNLRKEYSSPKSRMVPEVGRTVPRSMLIVDVFPAPLGPRKP